MKITAKTATNAEISTFLAQHKPGTIGYLLGEGAKSLGYTGECSIEDFLNITANPDHADKFFVHIKIAAPVNTEITTAVNQIAATAQELEQFIYGYQVQGNILGSFRAGMVAGLIFHSQTANGGKVPHGHLIVIPRVVNSDNGKTYFHQLDVKRLLKAVRG